MNFDTASFDIKEVEGKSSGLRSQVATSNRGRGGRRYLPFAFTSLGVAMLSSVLKSETAIAVNREIMRTFVSLSQLVKAPIPDNNPESVIRSAIIRGKVCNVLKFRLLYG